MVGNTELLTSNHQEVIDPMCIEGKYLFIFVSVSLTIIKLSLIFLNSTTKVST